MRGVKFSTGTNCYDFFVLPTVRVTRNNGVYTFLTVEWLKWYVGVSW